MYTSTFCNIIRNVLLIVLSILAGVLTAFTFSAGAVPYLRSVIKAVLLLSVLILTESTTAAILSCFIKNNKIKLCFSVQGLWLLIASMGTIITGILSLGVILDPASLAVVILTGIGGFFFCSMVLTNIYFFICLANRIKPLNDI